jgi:hypothetical protein
MKRRRKVSDCYSLHQVAVLNSATQLDVLENSILKADLDEFVNVPLPPRKLKKKLSMLLRKHSLQEVKPVQKPNSTWDYICMLFKQSQIL